MLTVGQLKEILGNVELQKPEVKEDSKKYVYGLSGLASLFNCSIVTAHNIKKSGKINAAIKQIGRKIIVDAELALELINKNKC
ncbi:DUF3853 family protein [Dysgonomonas sp.]